MHYSERKAYLNQFICNWDFLPLDLDEQELIFCAFSMLNQTFLQFTPDLDSFRMSDGTLYKLGIHANLQNRTDPFSYRCLV